MVTTMVPSETVHLSSSLGSSRELTVHTMEEVMCRASCPGPGRGLPGHVSELGDAHGCGSEVGQRLGQGTCSSTCAGRWSSSGCGSYASCLPSLVLAGSLLEPSLEMLSLKGGLWHGDCTAASVQSLMGSAMVVDGGHQEGNLQALSGK